MCYLYRRKGLLGNRYIYYGRLRSKLLIRRAAPLASYLSAGHSRVGGKEGLGRGVGEVREGNANMSMPYYQARR